MSSSIAELLRSAAEQLQPGSPTARLDAELLLAHVLGWSRARVLAERQHLLDAELQHQFEALVARRANLEPIAYLVGQREFYGLDFFVDRRVLVPRPETELLVERALAIAQQRPVTLIADICTGSGCIAVALAYHLPGAFVAATDLSADALAVAAANVERYQLGDRVMLLQGDLCEPLSGPVDLLVSNPPYTILSEIDAGVWRHEPHQALDGGFDGLDLYRRLLAQAPAYLRPGGAVLLEIGATQAADVVALGQTWLPQARAEVLPDLAGHDRVVVFDTGG